MIYQYDLRLGLPHTNARGLSEPLLMQQAGHFQWTSIAKAVGKPMSELRTLAGGEVYATFYYIEEVIPASAPLESFGLDEQVRFLVSLRAFKNLSVEGRIVFNSPDRLEAETGTGATDQLPAEACGRHPWIHFGNIFITPVKGNSALRVAPPANADFSVLASLPNEENPYHITRAAAETGALGILAGDWIEISVTGAPFVMHYRIDPDRDTNGAGLVYFANYVSFMEAAERQLLAASNFDLQSSFDLSRRSLRRRRIGYYGNVDPTDSIAIEVRAFTTYRCPGDLGLRFVIRRGADGAVICRSESIKALPPL